MEGKGRERGRKGRKVRKERKKGVKEERKEGGREDRGKEERRWDAKENGGDCQGLGIGSHGSYCLMAQSFRLRR